MGQIIYAGGFIAPFTGQDFDGIAFPFTWVFRNNDEERSTIVVFDMEMMWPTLIDIG